MQIGRINRRKQSVEWRQKRSDAGPGGRRRTGSDTILPERRLQVGRSSVLGQSPGVVWKCVSTLLRAPSCRCVVLLPRWLSHPSETRTRSRSETTRLWPNPGLIRNSVSPLQRPCVFVKRKLLTQLLLSRCDVILDLPRCSWCVGAKSN